MDKSTGEGVSFGASIPEFAFPPVILPPPPTIPLTLFFLPPPPPPPPDLVDLNNGVELALFVPLDVDVVFLLCIPPAPPADPEPGLEGQTVGEGLEREPNLACSSSVALGEAVLLFPLPAPTDPSLPIVGMDPDAPGSKGE